LITCNRPSWSGYISFLTNPTTHGDVVKVA
jgi:hypothetical protein